MAIVSRRTRSIYFISLWSVALVLSSCGASGDMFRSYDGTRTLPTTQTIPNPDSLRYVEVVTRPDSVAIILKRSISSLTQEWSSQVQPDPTFRPSPFNTFATLQGRELTLASLERRQGISSLSPDQARKRIEETLDTYANTIAFQVDLFIDTNRISAPLSTLRQQVVATLRIDGQRTYSSVRSQQASVQLTSRGSEGVYHYPMTVYFQRNVDGRDLLTKSNRFELFVHPFSTTAELSFEWRREG